MSAYVNSPSIFFNPILPHQTRPQHSCMFKRLGGCREYTSAFICNLHATRITNLYFRCVNVTDGNNDSRSFVVPHYSAYENMHLPLFVVGNTVRTKEVLNYANTVCNNNECGNAFGTINDCQYQSKLLADVIMRYLDVSAYNSTNTDIGTSWLSANRRDNYIFMVDQVENRTVAISVSDIPLFHRLLLAYTEPSITVNPQGVATYITPTVALVRYDANSSPAFKLVNKKLIHKYTSPDSLATPLVLFGQQRTHASDQSVIGVERNALADAQSCDR